MSVTKRPIQHSEKANEYLCKPPVLGYAGYIRKDLADPDWQSPWHMHDYLEVMLCTKGEGLIKIEENSYHVHTGDLIIYPKCCFHSETSCTGKSMEFFFMGIDSITSFAAPTEQDIDRNSHNVFPAGPYLPQLSLYMNELLHESSLVDDTLSLPNMCALSNLILTTVLRAKSLSLSEKKQRVSYSASVKEYIDTNYKNDINLTNIAETVYVSRHYISHIFKQDYGISPIEYLIEKRISIAQQLLLNSTLTINEIALQVGYKNSLYFSQIFKRRTGSSPTAYRKKHSENAIPEKNVFSP